MVQQDDDIASFVASPGSATRAALDSLYAGKSFFRHEDVRGALSYHESRVVLGSTENAINAASGDAAILSGGRALAENVIGGFEGNVNDNDASNLPADKTGAYDYSVIVGGYDNVNNSLASFIAGQHCLISESGGAGGGPGAGHHSIFGGSIHKIMAGGFHGIFGGTKNTISGTGTAASITGGINNVVSGDGGYSSIVGGNGNTITSRYAFAAGGTRNVVSGQSASVVGGNDNTASGASAAVVSGRGNVAGQDDSTAMGNNSSPTQPGGVAFAKGQFAAVGDAQAESFVARRETTDAATASLGIAGAATTVVMPTDSAWAVRGLLIASNTSDAVSQTAAWEFKLLVRRTGTGGATIVGSPTATKIAGDAGTEAWAVAFSTGPSPLNVRVTGEAGKTIRWVCRFDTAQVRG